MHKPASIVFSAALLLISVLLPGCVSDEASSPQMEVDYLEIISLDELWIQETDVMRDISVRIVRYDPENPEEYQNLECEIYHLTDIGTNFLSSFALYDDGNQGVWNDGLEYTDSLSGDRTFGDKVFSRRINSHFADSIGTYLFRFILQDHPDQLQIESQITLRVNRDPEFIAFSHPEAVPSGGSSDTFHVNLSDEDGLDDLQKARLLLYRDAVPGDRYTAIEMNRVNDAEWHYVPDATIAIGLATAAYPFVFQAQDHYLEQIGDFVHSDTFTVNLENHPPEIIDFSGPEVVRIPRTDTTAVFFEYHLDISDDQTFEDLDSLYVELLRDDSVIWSSSYIDGGSPIDTVRDGEFIAGFSANKDNPVGVEYLFQWIPSDRAGNQGEVFTSNLSFEYEEGTVLSKCSPLKRSKGYAGSRIFTSDNKRFTAD